MAIALALTSCGDPVPASIAKWAESACSQYGGLHSVKNWTGDEYNWPTVYCKDGTSLEQKFRKEAP